MTLQNIYYMMWRRKSTEKKKPATISHLGKKIVFLSSPLLTIFQESIDGNSVSEMKKKTSYVWKHFWWNGLVPFCPILSYLVPFGPI